METTAGALIASAVIALSGAAERPLVVPPLVVIVESKGNVLAVHADGKRVRLAAGRDPALSPDGKQLAFVRGRYVYVRALPDGRTKRRALGSSPAWAPDGRLAVATDVGVRVQGRLVAAHATDPAWSADGRLAVVTEAGIVIGAELVVPDGHSPAFAPDGRLAYVLADGVHVDGTLVAPGAREPAWDPAGRLTVVTAAGLLVDRKPLRGSRPGDRSPGWGRPPKAKPRNPNDLLPDLDQRAPSGLSIGGWGGRYRLGFTSATDNIGTGALWIRGRRPSTRTYEMRADQLIEQRRGGLRFVREVGRIRFVNDASHHHWHFMRFQQFELRRASDFELLVRDRKSGFCFADHYGLARHRVRNFRGPRFFGNCGQYRTGLMSIEMGTSPGYTDRYPAHFHGQNVDLTGVPSGVYVLVHRANAHGTIRETRYDNNAASVRIRLTWRRGTPSVRVLRTCQGSERC